MEDAVAAVATVVTGVGFTAVIFVGGRVGVSIFTVGGGVTRTSLEMRDSILVDVAVAVVTSREPCFCSMKFLSAWDL